MSQVHDVDDNLDGWLIQVVECAPVVTFKLPHIVCLRRNCLFLMHVNATVAVGYAAVLRGPYKSLYKEYRTLESRYIHTYTEIYIQTYIHVLAY